MNPASPLYGRGDSLVETVGSHRFGRADLLAAEVFGVDADVVAVGVALVSLAVAVIGVIIVVYQIGKAREQFRLDERSAFVGVLLQLDDAFASNAPHRQWVNDQHNRAASEQDQGHDLVPYLATFERVAMVVEEGLLPMERAYSFYSSRLRRLVRTEKARKLLTTQPHGWQLPIRLILDMDDHARSNQQKRIVIKQEPYASEKHWAVDEEFLLILSSLSPPPPRPPSDAVPLPPRATNGTTRDRSIYLILAYALAINIMLLVALLILAYQRG